MSVKNILTPDICIIGGGAANIRIAAGAVQLGVKTVLVDTDVIKDSNTNESHIASKALTVAANQTSIGRRAKNFGITFPTPVINRVDIAKYIAAAAIDTASQYSISQLEKLGVRVIRAQATFGGRDFVVTDSEIIRAKRFVVGIRSQMVMPLITGLDSICCFTEETIVKNTETIEHLLVVGGGAAALELAQAQRRLGAKVTLVTTTRISPESDADLIEFIREAVIADGISLKEYTNIVRLERTEKAIDVHLFNNEGATSQITVSHILVAVERKPNIEGMGLDKADVKFSNSVIKVDQCLRTTNRRIYAVDDCIDGKVLPHVADYRGSIVLRNILFRFREKINLDIIPGTISTDPELAYVGLLESTARLRFRDVRTEILDFRSNNSRARIEMCEIGRIKITLRASGEILGVGIVGRQAGELLAPWCLAISRKLTLSNMANLLLPYPTFSEISKQIAGKYYMPRLQSMGVKSFVRLLLKLP